MVSLPPFPSWVGKVTSTWSLRFEKVGTPLAARHLPHVFHQPHNSASVVSSVCCGCLSGPLAGVALEGAEEEAGLSGSSATDGVSGAFWAHPVSTIVSTAAPSTA